MSDERKRRTMIRLHQREQILILDAAHNYPGPLADWLMAWVAAQQRVGTGGSFDIGTIPIPKVDYPQTPEYSGPVDLDKVAPPTEKTRKELYDEFEKLLESIGYKELPKYVRKAVRKMQGTTIDRVEETERLPDNPECWLGDHNIEGWDADDCYLYRVIGKYRSGMDIKKWGCAECADAVAKTHPEADYIGLD